MGKLFLLLISIYEGIKDFFETWLDKEMSFKEKFYCSFIQIIIFILFIVGMLKLWKII